MNQSQSGESESEVVQLDAYKITAEDKNIAQSLEDALTRLTEVASELNASTHDHFPFAAGTTKECAKKLCLANIAVEMATLRLLMKVVKTKQILKEQDMDETVFKDIATLSPWLSHVQKLHGEHMQGIHAHLQQLVANVECREKEIGRVFEKSLVCKVHNQPAVGRSIDGKSLICKECQ